MTKNDKPLLIFIAAAMSLTVVACSRKQAASNAPTGATVFKPRDSIKVMAWCGGPSRAP